MKIPSFVSLRGSYFFFAAIEQEYGTPLIQPAW